MKNLPYVHESMLIDDRLKSFIKKFKEKNKEIEL